MTAVAETRRAPGQSLPAALDRRFEAVVFDWDGTAVPNRKTDATKLRELVEALTAQGLDLAVVTGTHVQNVDDQLGARPQGPGRLYLCMNRGSEVFVAEPGGLRLVAHREATPAEDAALDAAAEDTVARLAERGLRAEIVSQRLNRRKIDLIPEPEWADPPKARIAELLDAVESRLDAVGLRGLDEVVELARRAACDAGLPDPRVTSDAKHVEIGLTDKADSAHWLFDELARRGVTAGAVLVAGDEFGPLGGLAGSDSFLLVPEGERATVVSVGAEPTGVPEGVIFLGGGPEAFTAVLGDQLERRLLGEAPRLDADPLWTLEADEDDPLLERVNDSLFAIADGRIGTSDETVLAAGLYDGEGAATALLPCPLWHRLPIPDAAVNGRLRRLDLRSGLLEDELRTAHGTLRTTRFSSLARPGSVVLRAEGAPTLLSAGSTLAPAGPGDLELGAEPGRLWIRDTTADGGGVVAAAAHERRPTAGRLERLAAYRVDPLRRPDEQSALRAVRR
ncbi:MAG TPA: hypothetical protein VJ645_08395, partial [Gaiellaceae bacterium]|nr:hypothetical protein [Gaiellaceae bacterium]